MRILFPVLVVAAVVIINKRIRKETGLSKEEMKLSQQLLSLLLIALPFIVFFIIVMAAALGTM